MNFQTKLHYNLLLKLLIAIVVLNIVLVFSMVLQNFMFYNKNYAGANHNVTQTQTVVIDNQEKVEKININNCSLEALKELRGIGEKKAASIINARPYKDIYEIKKVVGDTTFENIKKHITV